MHIYESKLNALAHLPAKKPAMANESTIKRSLEIYCVIHETGLVFSLICKVISFTICFSFGFNDGRKTLEKTPTPAQTISH